MDLKLAHNTPVLIDRSFENKSIRLRVTFDIEIPLDEVLEYPTDIAPNLTVEQILIALQIRQKLQGTETFKIGKYRLP